MLDGPSLTRPFHEQLFSSFLELPRLLHSANLPVTAMTPDELKESVNRAWLEKFVHNGFVKNQHRNNSYSYGSSRLHDVAGHGNVFLVRGLLGAGADTRAMNGGGKTPLDKAREWCRAEVINYIVWGHGAIVRVLAERLGRPPVQMEIYAAATHKRMRRFRFYVQRDIDKALNDLLGAARAGDLMTVRSMVEGGEIGVDMMDNTTHETAFSLALANKHRDICVYLMDKGAKLDGACVVNDRRLSILLGAVLTGDVSFVRRVAAHDASVLRPIKEDTSRTCAMAEAIKMGSIAMIEMLLDVGISLNRAKNGLGLPWLASSAQYWIKVSDPSNEKAEPWLLLCAACWIGDKALFEYLLKTRSKLRDFSASPRDAAIVLFFAVYGGSEELALLLLKRGASASQSFASSVTAMSAAVVTNSTRMLQLLIDHGGDVLVTSYNTTNERDCYYDALLSAAVSTGAMDCAHMLLPVETRPEHRGRALLMAARRGDLEFASRLLADPVVNVGDWDLIRSIQETMCPLVLDLLLTQYGRTRADAISEFNVEFRRSCCWRRSPSLLAVFVSHGAEVHAGGSGTDNRGWPGIPSVSTLRFLVENGIPIVTESS